MNDQFASLAEYRCFSALLLGGRPSSRFGVRAGSWGSSETGVWVQGDGHGEAESDSITNVRARFDDGVPIASVVGVNGLGKLRFALMRCEMDATSGSRARVTTEKTVSNFCERSG